LFLSASSFIAVDIMNQMAIVSGTLLGPYQIVAPIGAGGMGEVYRAVDTRLDRTVAIKVLPSHLSGDPLFRQRFEREARTISSLSHPHICALHDVGHQDGVDYLVMEFLEGETLAQRLAKGRLTIEQTLRYGIEIADALNKAHKQGVVHRDLKPGNIMLTKSGLKLLDFGLAKFHLPEAKAILSGVSALVTKEQKNLTAEGSIVGTFQYMAPEQLEGKEIDPRTDIFAMGVILYEMATGQKAFTGTSHASLIAAILSSEPAPISQVQPMTPPALDRVVKTCLAKNPEDRWQTAHDVMLELKWIAEAGSQAGVPAPVVAKRKSREQLAWLLSALFFIATLSFGYTTFRFYQSQKNVHPVRSLITAPEGSMFRLSGTDAGSLSISPNGRWLTFAASDSSGKTALWIRPLDSLKARMLSGTEDGEYPFWSPDSRFIGFFANGKLKKMDIAGGPSLTVCDAQRGRGGSWNQRGMILFAPNTQEPIYSVEAVGGAPTQITKLNEEKRESTHRLPYFLPDGNHFLYVAGSHKNPVKGEANAIYVASLDGKLNKLLVHAGSNAAYANGLLLFVREKVLMAQHFDVGNLELQSDPFPVAEQIQFATGWWNGAFTVSQNGILSYAIGSGDDTWQLAWFDRTGKMIHLLEDRAAYNFFRLSPDERMAAVAITDPDTGNDHIWLYELSRGVRTRFTFSSANDSNPVWSPDGTRIAYTNDGSGNDDIFQKPSTGAGAEEPLLQTDINEVPTSWSPDGRFLCYEYHDLKGKEKGDIWILPLFGDRKSFPFKNSQFDERNGSFSPDGKWIAYTSDESGRKEVYVAPFPGRAGKWQVSHGAFYGTFWRKDGKELIYLSPDIKLMSVPVKTDPTFESGTPVVLFDVSMSNYGSISSDGQRILLSLRDAGAPAQPITIVTNWTSDLPQK
jgi:eukaryotic-like serine/threonine-protein kinase